MTTLHLNTETGYQTCLSLKGYAAQALEEAQALQRAIKNLSSAWQGGRAVEFSHEATVLANRIQEHIFELQALAERLQSEVREWEEVDRRGAAVMRGERLDLVNAFANQIVPFSAGGNTSYLLSVPPVATVLSIGSFLGALPSWLSSILDRFFAPVEVVSPIADGPVTPPSQTPSSPTTGFGELLKETPATAPTETSVASASAKVPAAQNAYENYSDVPLKSQGDHYGNAACAPTSVSMVLDYYKAQNPDLKTASPTELIGMLDAGDGTPGKGVGLHLMNDDLKELGYNNITVKAEAGYDDLNAALNDGPVIVTAGVKLIGGGARDIQQAGNTIHAMVVKGINADSVILNDPWSGAEKTFSRETFSQMWSKGSNGMYVIRP